MSPFCQIAKIYTLFLRNRGGTNFSIFYALCALITIKGLIISVLSNSKQCIGLKKYALCMHFSKFCALGQCISFEKVHTESSCWGGVCTDQVSDKQFFIRKKHKVHRIYLFDGGWFGTLPQYPLFSHPSNRRRFCMYHKIEENITR